MKKVFLSGPMRGVARVDALRWRNDAIALLAPKFDAIHALRGREEKETFTDPKSAIIRDLNDIRDCDIVLVNDMNADASMIGTAMEVFYAFENKKPVIVFGNGHEKDYWLNYHSHMRAGTLEEACDILNKMFS